jgi:hypothetical protein
MNMLQFFHHYATLAKSIIKLAEENGINKKKLQQILPKTVNLRSGEQLRYDDLLKARVDLDFVIRFERKTTTDYRVVLPSTASLSLSVTSIKQPQQSIKQRLKIHQIN